MSNYSMYSASSIQQQKKKHSKNPFTFFFTKQYKSTPTNSAAVILEEEEKQGIFGVPLCDASKVGSILWGLQVPDPVALCFLEISKRGLKTEGIFRLSGATSEVNLLENKINMYTPEERKEKINATEFDIHTLTSLVKKYLRELPEPVIPNAFHEQFQSVDLNNNGNGVHGLGSIIVKLPFYNRQLLHAILLMASRIQQHVNINMMCPEALATVFAPVCTGFEQSLKDMRISSSSSSTTCSSTFKKASKNKPTSTSNIEKTTTEMIGKHIKRNKNWTNIWKVMIEQHATLISILDKQHYSSQQQYSSSFVGGDNNSWAKNQHVYNCAQQQRSLSSPFSTNGSSTPLPNDIIMEQFHPISPAGIPVITPSSSPSFSKLAATRYNTRSRYTPSPPPPVPTHHYNGGYYEDFHGGESSSAQPPPPPPLPPKSSASGGVATGTFRRSISKKTSFFQKNNTIRKILSASTLR